MKQAPHRPNQELSIISISGHSNSMSLSFFLCYEIWKNMFLQPSAKVPINAVKDFPLRPVAKDFFALVFFTDLEVIWIFQ
jgi:hypothetical protein